MKPLDTFAKDDDGGARITAFEAAPLVNPAPATAVTIQFPGGSQAPIRDHAER
jgi:hypothetical protein